MQPLGVCDVHSVGAARSASPVAIVMQQSGREGADPLFGPMRFEELFEAEQRRLYGALCLITRDPHEAEEIGQEAFARVWERWGRIGRMEEPEAYLYRVAMNVFRSRYRRARVAARHAMHSDLAVMDEIADFETRDTLDRLLAELIPQQRAAIVLTGMLGYSSDEAGKLLGMRGSTVRVLTTRARALLRDKATERG